MSGANGNEPLFHARDGLFVPTRRAASPWLGGATIHGGPAAGLLAHAVERALPGADWHVARLTMDLFRPVPSAPLATATQMLRDGKRIKVIQASLAHAGVEVSRATALVLRKGELDIPDRVRAPQLTLKGPEGIESKTIWAALRDEADPAHQRKPTPGFHMEVEARRVPVGGGHGRAGWVRMPMPFVDDVEPSPLVRLATLSDFTNAIGISNLVPNTPFINADITLYVNRYPVGEWVLLHVHGLAEPAGFGISHGILSDLQGVVAASTVAVIPNG